jgi:hypothetical protein
MVDERGITPALRGFLHVALLRRMSLLPLTDRATRRQMAEDFLQIKTDEQAREYIHAARLEVRAAKLRARGRESTSPPRSDNGEPEAR